MRLYADTPARRTRQILSDVLMLLWIGFWVYAGRQVHDLVTQLRAPADSITSAGRVGQRRPHGRRRPGRADPARRRPAADVADAGGRVGHDAQEAGTSMGDTRRHDSPLASASRRRSCRSSSSSPCGSACASSLRAQRDPVAALHRRRRGPRPLRAPGHGDASRCGRWPGCPTTRQVRGAVRTATSSGASPCSSCATRACGRRPAPSPPLSAPRQSPMGSASRRG